MKQIVWKIVPDTSTLTLQLLSGEVDGAAIAEPRDLVRIQEAPNLAVYPVLGGNFQISLQLQNPLFQDRGVRQALAHALDKQAMADKIMAGAAVIAHLILPAFVLSLHLLAQFLRFTRAGLLEALGQGYVCTARAKGLSEPAVLIRHTFRNAAIPLITLLGLTMPQLVSGCVVVETVFAWPGLGRLMVEAAFQRNYSVLMGDILLVGGLVVLGSLLADGRASVLAGTWWVALFPGLMILLVTLTVNLLGDEIQTALRAFSL